MTQTEDPESTIARLREEITRTRKQRMAAQKTVATTPNLEIALDRVARDRSSGATGETDALRMEIDALRQDIVHEVRQIDKVRTLFPRVDAEYPELSPRTRLVRELNEEEIWRRGMLSNERSIQLRIMLPRPEVIA
jgi:uncharacterized coiled-coil DUF342 family protein